MSDFFSGELTLDTRGKSRSKKNPVIHIRKIKDEVKLTFLVEYWLSSDEIKNLIRFIESNTEEGYQILCCFDFSLSQKEMKELGAGQESKEAGKRTSNKENKKNVTKFYQSESVNLSQYVNEYSIILPIGKALYALSDSLRTDFFYDTLLGYTYFWHPMTKTWCYPLPSICDSLGKDTFERFFTVSQIDASNKRTDFPKRIPIEEFIYVQDPNKFLKDTMGERLVAFDTETTGLDFMIDTIFCMTISFDGKTGYYLDMDKTDISILNDWFVGKKLIMANGKFDLKMLWKHGISQENAYLYFDTMNAHHCINEMQSHSLKTQAWLFDKCGGYELELERYKEKYNVKDYSKIPKDMILEYAIKDTLVTYRMYEIFTRMMDELEKKTVKRNMTLQQLFFDIVMPSVRMFAEIEYRGVSINVEELRNAGALVRKQIDETVSKIRKYKGFETVDLSSGEQLAKVIEGLGWKDHGKSKKGLYLTNVKCLSEWAKEHEEAKLMMLLREKQTLYRMFIGNEEIKAEYDFSDLSLLSIDEDEEIDEQDSFEDEDQEECGTWRYLRKHEDGSDRVHPNFGVMMADSLRLRCSKPNLQQWPSKGDSAKITRTVFCPPSKDHVFVSADSAGIQLRIAAIMAKEETMKDIFVNQNGDLHSKTAIIALLNNRVSLQDFIAKKNEQPFKGIRQKAKNLNFLLLFGGGASLVYRSFVDPFWTEAECDDFIKDNKLKILTYKNKPNKKYTVATSIHEKFFQTYPNLAKWGVDSKEFASKYGYIKSMYGTIRRFPYLVYTGRDDSGKRTSNSESITLNSPVQSIETIIMQRAAVELFNRIKEEKKDCWIFNMIHDAIEMYSSKNDLEWLCKTTKEVFEKQREEYWGIGFEMEGNCSDYYGADELWDMGHKWDKYLTKKRKVVVNND